MNNEHRNPEDLTEAGDRHLGASLGSAIRRRVEAPAEPPPVSRIAERAAARAKARHVRQAVAGIAASVALVGGGIAAWNALEEDQPTEVIAADQPAIAQDADPVPAPAPDPNAGSLPGGPEAADAEAPTPQSLSTGPLLEWEALDAAAVMESDLSLAYGLTSTGDGRAVVQAPSSDGNRVLVSEDGRGWTALDVPAGLSVESIDIAGDRWLVSGRRYDGAGRHNLAFYSDNQGGGWEDLGLPPSDPSERADIAAALVSGQNILVAVKAATRIDLESVIAARGLVSDESEIAGWTSLEGDTLRFTRDLDSPAESFVLTPQEQDQLFGQREEMIRFYRSQGGTAQLAAVYPGWSIAGRSTSDGFRFVLFSDEGDFLLTTADGRGWERSPLDGSPATSFGAAALYHGSSNEVVWTSGGAAGDLLVERSPGAYAPALVAELPDGIRRVDHLAVGPAGVAVWAAPGAIWGRSAGPQVAPVRKGGFELRFNEPLGGATLVSLASQAPVLEISPEEMAAESPPEGMRLVEDASGRVEQVIFEDPGSGEVLVAFSQDELAAAAPSPAPEGADFGQSEPSPAPGQWIGWSADGHNWGWQSATEAFGLDQGSEASVELAVGADFVIARVQTYRVVADSAVAGRSDDGGASDPGRSDDDGAVAMEAEPAHWFFAKVG